MVKKNQLDFSTITEEDIRKFREVVELEKKKIDQINKENLEKAKNKEINENDEELSYI